MKHGRQGLPFKRIRKDQRHYIKASCSQDNCGSVKELALSKWLPEDVISGMLERDGWMGYGQVQPGVPKRFVCPKCVEDANRAIRSSSTELIDKVNQSMKDAAQGVSKAVNKHLEIGLSCRAFGNYNALVSVFRAEQFEFLGLPLDRNNRASLCVDEEDKLVIELSPSGDRKIYKNSSHSLKTEVNAKNLALDYTGPLRQKPFVFTVEHEEPTAKIVRLVSKDTLSEIIEELRGSQENKAVRILDKQDIPELKEATPQKESQPKPELLSDLESGTAIKQWLNEWVEKMEKAGWEIVLNLSEDKKSLLDIDIYKKI